MFVLFCWSKEDVALKVPPPEKVIPEMPHAVQLKLLPEETVAAPLRGLSYHNEDGAANVPVILVNVVIVVVTPPGKITLFGEDTVKVENVLAAEITKGDVLDDTVMVP